MRGQPAAGRGRAAPLTGGRRKDNRWGGPPWERWGSWDSAPSPQSYSAARAEHKDLRLGSCWAGE